MNALEYWYYEWTAGRIERAANRPLQRVLAKVRVDELGCWRWTGAKSLKRRGSQRPVFWLNHRTVSVARTVCGWFRGPAPSPVHEAGHTCPHGERDDCVNPNHLTWQTREENERHKHAY